MNGTSETETSSEAISPFLWPETLARTGLQFYGYLSASKSRSRQVVGISTRDPHTEHQQFHYEQQLESSTAQEESSADLYKRMEASFRAAREQIFEDGMESEFSKQLVALIKSYGNAAMDALTHLVVYEKVNAEAASEALRWLGQIDHPPTYSYRLWLLERSLRCSSARVRDAAALGLASLDDPRAISSLKQAICLERCIELREDMQQVLSQLETTYKCHSS